MQKKSKLTSCSQKQGPNPRSKGKRGEGEVVKILEARGLHARRTSGQYTKGDAGQFPDVSVMEMPNIHAEVKRQEHLSLGAWYRQAQKDACEGQEPIVITRRSREPWMVWCRFEHYLDLYIDAHGLPMRNTDKSGEADL